MTDINPVHITMIAAIDKDYLIGAEGDLPWHLPRDLRYFKATTRHKPIIMGRKTYEAVGHPLAQRTNIIMTRNQEYQADGCYIAHDMETAVSLAMQHLDADREIMIIGGGMIYTAFLPQATKMHLTHVHVQLAGDSYFPTFDPQNWEVVKKQSYPADDRHAYAFDIVEYNRASND